VFFQATMKWRLVRRKRRHNATMYPDRQTFFDPRFNMAPGGLCGNVQLPGKLIDCYPAAQIQGIQNRRFILVYSNLYAPIQISLTSRTDVI
jgi:hypothetical protein